MPQIHNHNLDQAAFIKFRMWCALAFLIIAVALQLAFGRWPVLIIVLATIAAVVVINSCRRFFVRGNAI